MNVSRYWIILLVAAGLFGASGVLALAGWFGARGVKLHDASCAWDAEGSQYLAQVAVTNQEDAFKMVALGIRFKIKPSAGQSWPHQVLRQQYGTVNQRAIVMLGPKDTAQAADGLQAPGLTDFLCDAEATVSRQIRFKDKPSAELIEAASAQLGQGSGRAADRGMMRRRML